MRRMLLLFTPVALLLAYALPAGAVTPGQHDDFQDGTTQGWGSGVLNPNSPANAADVGPTGAGDHSLQLTSTGSLGPGSRFAAFNTTQWAGDFLSASASQILMDVNNIGATPLNLRVAFEGPGGRFVTTASVPVPAGSGWQSIALGIEPIDLTSAGGLDLNATLGAVTSMRVISAASPSFMGDAIVAQGLIDNVLLCGDVDGDGFEAGSGCTLPDLDDHASSCTDDGSDSDGDAAADCLDLCLDADGDDYGVDLSATVIGSGVDPVGACTTDGSTACTFLDAACIGPDCDDSNPDANVECAEPVPAMKPWGTGLLVLALLLAGIPLGRAVRRSSRGAEAVGVTGGSPEARSG